MGNTGKATQPAEDAVSEASHNLTPRMAVSLASSRDAAGRVFPGPAGVEAEAEPIPVSEVSPLIQRNQSVAKRLLATVGTGQVVFYHGVEKREVPIIAEVARVGSFTFTNPKKLPKVIKHTCWSEEFLDVLEALVSAPLGSMRGGFKILSTMREPQTSEKGEGRFNQHGRILADSEVLIDFLGRRVNGMSTGLDIAGFGGHDINLAELGAKSGATFANKKAASIAGVAAVLASLPGSSTLRYSIGLPRPEGKDEARIGEDDVTVFIPVSPVPPPPGAPPLRKGRAAVPRSSPTGSLRGDLKFVYSDARAKLADALADNMNRPHIVIMYADGVDHLHLTAYRPSDTP